MIINGGSRSNGAFFSRHLMRADENERVQLVEMRGLAAESVPDAFQEMSAVASGTRVKNFFYHANLNTRADEVLTPEQWALAVDRLEAELGYSDQPRFIVEHEKEGRTHRHVVWSRIDADSMTALSDSHNYRTHELVAAELEETFGHQATERALTRDKDNTPRPDPNVQDWESFRAAESRIDPKAMRAELTELWQQADSGQAFAAALAERGYILARGDRRDFCVIDAAGDEHSLARRISGVKAAAIRERMADVDATALPSVADGRELARAAQDAPTGDAAFGEPLNAFDAILAERMQEAEPPAIVSVENASSPAPASAFDAIMAERRMQDVAQERAVAAEIAENAPEGRFAAVRAWWGSMRGYVAGFGDQVRDYYGRYFHHGDEAETHQPSHDPNQDMEPQR